MLIRLGLNYAAHLAGGIAVGTLAVVAFKLARKAGVLDRPTEQSDGGAEHSLVKG